MRYTLLFSQSFSAANECTSIKTDTSAENEHTLKQIHKKVERLRSPEIAVFVIRVAGAIIVISGRPEKFTTALSKT